MKKRLLAILVILTVFGFSASAQKDSKFFVALQGGGVFSMNENGGGYFATGRGGELVSGQGALTFGYYFIPRIGVRLQGELSGNASAGNYEENNYVLAPYKFQSFLAFADVVINGGNVSVPKPFNWRLFAGLGLAYSYAFNPSQIRTACASYNFTNYTTFAFRFGFQLEYIFRCGVAPFFEACHEWMTDNYNGQAPTDEYGNHLGFPFDTKLNFSLGVAYHF